VFEGYDININWDTWEMNNIFKLIMEKGNVPIDDMRRTFNLGIGLILIINENHLDNLKSHLNMFNEECIVIGDVVEK
jgi:phosphoribosylaminoimidazole (AIR) synthetase